MRGNEFLDKMSLIDPAYIDGAEVVPKRKRLTPVKKLLITAACFVLMFSVGFGTYAYAAEAREYKKAVQFFNDYVLSTDGLTREEIKNVYRDITSNSFSDDKTIYVIATNISPDMIKDYVVPNENATPEEVENFWNYRNSAFNAPSGEKEYCQTRHEYEKRILNEGSCTEDRTQGNVCVNCGWSYVTQKLGKVHTFGEYVVTVPMTCENDGLEVAVCVGCGIKDERVIPASHVSDGDNYTVVIESTCTNKGRIRYNCRFCGERIREELPLLEHDWDISEITATCWRGDQTIGICKVCAKHTVFEETLPLGHDYELLTDGDWRCNRCQMLHSEMHDGHTYKTVKKEATCSAEGIVYVGCRLCNVSGETAISKKAHRYQAAETIDPTCVSGGMSRKVCLDCGHVEITEYEKLIHSFELVEGMTKKYMCTECGLVMYGRANYGAVIDIKDSISVDGEKDEIYNSTSKIVSHKDVYEVSYSAEKPNGDFEAWIVLGQKGMYIYAEIKDNTQTHSLKTGCGDYIKLYLDWCTSDLVHPSDDKKAELKASGRPWDPVNDYRDIYGISGLQYIGWLQGYSNGMVRGGMGFAPIDSLGPDENDTVVYKSIDTDDGWACEWFIPWRDDEQKQMIKDNEQFHIGFGIEVGDDTAVKDGESKVAVKRFDQNKKDGIEYVKDYSLLVDLDFGELWIYRD